MPIGEGKSPMSPAGQSLTPCDDSLNKIGFLFLTQKALTAESDFSISTTAHVSLVMCWNLIARVASVASIHLENISWEGIIMHG